jgi:hypothetical protein
MGSNKGLTVRAIVVGFLQAVVVSCVFLVSTAVPSQAANCGPAYDWRDIRTPSTNNNEWGVKASAVLVTGLEPCVQHRTLYVWHSSDDFVEIGWYRDGSSGQSLDLCTNSTAPRVLVFQKRNGAKSCKPNTPVLTGGQSYSFKIQNPEHDLSFTFWWGVGSIPDTALGPYQTDHINGQAKASTERHQYEDSLRGDFTGVNSLGSSVWHALPNVVTQQGGDPYPYIVCSYGSTYLHVNTLSGCG